MRMRLLLYLLLLAWPVQARTPYLVTTLYSEVEVSKLKCRQGDSLTWASPELHDEAWRLLNSVTLDELKGIW